MRYSQLATVAGLVAMAAAAPINAGSAVLEARAPAFGVGPAANVAQAKYIDRNMKKNKHNVKVYETTVKNTGKPPKTSSSSKPKAKPAPKKGKRDVEAEEEADEEADEEGAALEARSPAFGVGKAANVAQAKYIDRNMKKNKHNVKVYETTVKNTGKPPKTSSSNPKSKPAPKKGKRDVEDEEADEEGAALEARAPAFGVGPAANVAQAKYIDRNMKKNKHNVKVYETTVKNTGKPPKTSSSDPKSKPAPKKKGKRDVEDEEADEEAEE